MSILNWIRSWTGVCLFFGTIIIILFLVVSGIAWLTFPTNSEPDPETGECGLSKYEVSLRIWEVSKYVSGGILVIYILGVILGSAMTVGWYFIVEEKVKFK